MQNIRRSSSLWYALRARRFMCRMHVNNSKQLKQNRLSDRFACVRISLLHRIGALALYNIRVKRVGHFDCE